MMYAVEMVRHPPHIMYLTSHVTQGLAGGVLQFRRCTDVLSPPPLPPSGCIRTVLTLHFTVSHTVFICV